MKTCAGKCNHREQKSPANPVRKKARSSEMDLVYLQQTIGNQAVLQMLQSGGSERKKDCSCGGGCEDCKAKSSQKHHHVQTKRAGSSDASNSALPSIVHEVQHSAGQPLDAATRSFMEPRLGHNFSDVRVHTDARAAESARSIDALAYTFQNHLVLDSQSVPHGSYARQRVMAHELSHVVQQSRSAKPKESGISSDAAAEAQADRAAQQVMRGHRVNVGGFAVDGLMRIPRSAQHSLSPEAMSNDEIEKEIWEIEAYLQLSPVNSESNDHLTIMRQALLDEQQKRKGLPTKAETSPSTGLAVPTTQAKPTPPFYGMKAADNAFSGIKLHYVVSSLPGDVRVEHTFKRGPYLLALHHTTLDDGSRRISYYMVYRRADAVLAGNEGWNEYVVGPDSIEQFLGNLKTYEGAAAPAYFFGPPAPYQAEAGKMSQNLMEGNVGEAFNSLGRSWVEAVQDPGWLASFASSGAGAVGRVAPRAPLRAPTPPRLTSIPGGRPGRVPLRTGPGGRPVVASTPKTAPAQAPVAQAGGVKGNTALAPAPVQQPVPAPAPKPGPVAVPSTAKPATPSQRGSLAPAVGAVGAVGASAARPAKQPAPAPDPQKRPDETKRRTCMEKNPGAQVCDEPVISGPGMMEEVLVDFLLSQTHKDFEPDDLGTCTQQGDLIPAGEINDCNGAPAISYHCKVRGETVPLSIFGCLCCDIQGATHYQWSRVHWSTNLSKRGRK